LARIAVVVFLSFFSNDHNTRAVAATSAASTSYSAPPKSGSNQTFEADGSPWIIPGDYETGFSTVNACYQAGHPFTTNKERFMGWKRVTFIVPAEQQSRDVFLFGYGDNYNKSFIWKIQFRSCLEEIHVVPYFDLAANNIPLDEQVVALSASDASGHLLPNFVVTSSSIYMRIKTRDYLRSPLPKALNSSDVYPLITGLFLLGVDEVVEDNIYLGRGRADPRAPGQLVIYETDDETTFFKYNRTVELAAAPLNLEINALGFGDCEFYSHRALKEASVYLVNDCHGELNQSETKYVNYDTSGFDYITSWPSPNATSLILTSSEAAK